MEIRNIIIFVIFILGIVYMQFIQAHPVKEIIRKYIEAREVKEKLQSIQSLYMEGFREMMGNTVIIKITKVQGKLYRNDFEFGDMSGYTIVTPGEGWYLIPGYSAMPEPIPEDRLNSMQAELDINGPLVDYAAKGHTAELEGKEDVNGKEAYKIRLILRNGDEKMYFIDTRSNLLVQTRQVSTGLDIPGMGNTGAERESITNYGDYNLVDGILFPYTISNPADVPGGGTITFSRIEVNKTIDESQYRPYRD